MLVRWGHGERVTCRDTDMGENPSRPRPICMDEAWPGLAVAGGWADKSGRESETARGFLHRRSVKQSDEVEP